jgi:hypothetical protein
MSDKKKEQAKEFLDSAMPDKGATDDISGKVEIKIGGDVADGNTFAGRDVINNITQANSKLLTTQQRRDLNKLVRRLDVEYGESGAQTWTSIHRILDVNGIDTMLIEQYKPTEAILQLLIDRAQLRHKNKNQDDDGDLRAQLDQSASALTKLTERNGEMASNLKKYQQAYTILETRNQKQAAEIKSLESQAGSLASQLQRAQEQAKRVPAAQASISTGRKHLLMALGYAAVVSVGAVVLGVQGQSLHQRLQTTTARLTVCEFAGKFYSVGSVADIKGSPGATCTMVKDDLPPQWSMAKQKVDKKPSVARNPIRRKPPVEITDTAPL